MADREKHPHDNVSIVEREHLIKLDDAIALLSGMGTSHDSHAGERFAKALRALPTVSVTDDDIAARLKELGYARLEFQLDSTGGHEANYYTQEGAERKALRALPTVSVTDEMVNAAAVEFMIAATLKIEKDVRISELTKDDLRMVVRAALEAALGATVSDGWEDIAEAARYYMSQIGQGYEAHKLPMGPTQIEADRRLRAALAALGPLPAPPSE